MRHRGTMLALTGFSLTMAACTSGKKIDLEMQREVVLKPPAILSVAFDPSPPIDTGSSGHTVKVSLRGDAGLEAAFDVSGLDGRYQNLSMRETAPGVYEGAFGVPQSQAGELTFVGRLVDPPSGARQEHRASIRLVSTAPAALSVTATYAKATSCTAEVATVFDVELKPLTLYFDFDKAELKDREVALLSAGRELLKTEPWCKLQVHGHADELGTSEYNSSLSQRRANAVARHLESLGVAPDRVQVFAHGYAKPAEPGKTAETGWRNRRVEIRAVNPY